MLQTLKIGQCHAKRVQNMLIYKEETRLACIKLLFDFIARYIMKSVLFFGEPKGFLEGVGLFRGNTVYLL